jgi:hypothetical protein
MRQNVAAESGTPVVFNIWSAGNEVMQEAVWLQALRLGHYIYVI